MVFSRKKFDEFRSDVEAALEDVGEKYGVSIEAGSISYNDIEFKMGLKMGAQTFMSRAVGKTAREAFDAAVAEAQYGYGHRGYIWLMMCCRLG